MARAAPASKMKSSVTARKPNRAVASVTKAPAATPVKTAVAKPVAVVKKTNATVAARPVATKAQAPVPAPAPAPKLSKGELRDQLEKMEATNAKLRAKGRETNKALKLATKQIADLETQVTQLERDAEAGRAAAVARTEPKIAAPLRKPRRPHAIDPGDAVLPSMAVIEPAPGDAEAAVAHDNLENNLHGE